MARSVLWEAYLIAADSQIEASAGSEIERRKIMQIRKQRE
jgi:hypothetical protein